MRVTYDASVDAVLASAARSGCAARAKRGTGAVLITVARGRAGVEPVAEDTNISGRARIVLVALPAVGRDARSQAVVARRATRRSAPAAERTRTTRVAGEGLAGGSALARGETPKAPQLSHRYAVRSGGWVASPDKDLAAVMTERFGHPRGYVGAQYGLGE